MGDPIYFVTGNGTDGSDANGVSTVMLSLARDGLALQKNKQYYLKEVFRPQDESGNEYNIEDIYWAFTISDFDDYSKYVYSDGSVLQISNASPTHELLIRKKIVDQTGLLKKEDYQNTTFDITGVKDGKTVFHITRTYRDFANVDVPVAGGGTQTDKVLIFHDLPDGTYTVKEIRDSAVVTDPNRPSIDLTTSAQVTTVTKQGDEAPTITDESYSSSDNNCMFIFKLDSTNGKSQSVDANFTNTYTLEDTVPLTIKKIWGNDTITPKSAEFAVYAGTDKYPLSEAEGGNANGNVVLPKDGKWTVKLKLPKNDRDGNEIRWSVE